LLGVEADYVGEADIEGLMAGFGDLFFEYNGKYYILDWKSNYLGSKPEYYGPSGLTEAMMGNNYNRKLLVGKYLFLFS
jgi:exodeoxyribonuclease V beta subunit